VSGAIFHGPEQVALAHNADDLTGAVHNRHCTDAVHQKESRSIRLIAE
jgi:hypothetical protein